MSKDKNGILYICPTPIGNLKDITLRVLETLSEVDLIACEDTRITQKLLNHFEIKTRLTSYHKFSEKEKAGFIVNFLKEGKNIALVSDAGTPLISDPGENLIEEALKNNIKIIPLPGPSSVITALSASPLSGKGFIFTGFLPRAENEIKKIAAKYSDTNIVCFESAKRLVKTLEVIKGFCGEKRVTVAREITKLFEEIKTGNISEIMDFYTNNPPKGEVTLIIEKTESKEETEIAEKIKALHQEGFSVKEISKILSVLFSLPKNHVYSQALDILKSN